MPRRAAGDDIVLLTVLQEERYIIPPRSKKLKIKMSILFQEVDND